MTGPVCGCSLQTYEHRCAANNAGYEVVSNGECVRNVRANPFTVSGPGDAFPVSIIMDGEGESCISMPQNPALSMEQSAERPISTLGPGESMEIEVVARAFPLCPNGSCSQGVVSSMAAFQMPPRSSDAWGT